MCDPFAAIREALDRASDPSATIDHDRVRIDSGRRARTGIPEVVLAHGKGDADLIEAIERLVRGQGRTLVSRLNEHQITLLSATARFPPGLMIDAEAGMAVVASDDGVKATGGKVAIVSAGSSDRRVAQEAELMAIETGCATRLVIDVGVAGLHRLVEPLTAIMSWRPDALIVAAGMDGALPSVIAGLVDVPVIGLPVSVGYGYGGDGTAALMSMLQSCAPGMSVVNIDNGIGAGAMAARIANRAAAARGQRAPEEDERP